MTNILLRSGCPQDFFLYGEDGHRVFDFAPQLRETLRIRGFDQVLALLAIPQCHENGQRVDWYSPSLGPVTPWGNASQTERDNALRCIAECYGQLQIAQQDSLATHDSNGKLFGALLSKILYYPGPLYIYFVNERPVITFWGFSLEDQDPPLPHTSITIASDSPVLAATVNDTLLEEPSNVPSSGVFPERLPKSCPKKSLKNGQIILLGISLMAGVLGYSLMQGASRAKTTPKISKPVTLLLEQTPPRDPLPLSTLPVEAASFLSEQTFANEAAPPNPVPISCSVLSLPLHALKRGTTAFLSGRWQVQRIDGPGDPSPIDNLTYNLTDNTGSMVSQTATQGECRAQVLAGWLPSGRLRIKPSSEVRCRRGAHGTLPTLLCRINIQGETLCKAYTAQQKPIAIRLVQVPAQCE